MKERMIVMLNGKEYLVLYCAGDDFGMVVTAILMPLHRGQIEYIVVLNPKKILNDTFTVQETYNTLSFVKASEKCHEWTRRQLG